MKIIFEKKKKKKKGLWANIHAKRERGESPAKPGEEGYPDKKQWKKLTKEEIEQVVSEEIENIFEAEDQVAEEDPKKKADARIKDAAAIAKAAEQEKRAQAMVNKVRPPEQQTAKQADMKSKIEQEKIAKDDLKKAKESAQQISEEKSDFQKVMKRKGKGWKIRLLTKGKQPAGSAYPNKAPVERAKSAPPGAGGV
jgi:hypothetical protein